jgi:hypothetical protein
VQGITYGPFSEGTSAGLNRRARRGFVGVGVVVAMTTACTSFATVRSAEVYPGPSIGLQVSGSTPPGDDAGWFWSQDCAADCNHPIVGGDVGLSYGWTGRKAFALGLGVSGTHPYIDGYLQLGSGRSPYGIGARVGPISNWREHQLYGRYDVSLGGRSRLLLNPALFVHEGQAPNGENPGTFIGFVQGVGLLFEGEHVSWTPALALVAGRAERTSYGTKFGPTTSVFGAASLGMTVHRRRN